MPPSFNHLFGPVPSRRLGRSLGVDVVPLKTCSYNCNYCQLGPTTTLTAQRRPYVAAGAVVAELEQWLSGDDTADFITLSGSGEPTLNTELGTVLGWLKDHTATPVSVLTNGSLLWMPEVRRDLSRADLLVPSLDTATKTGFRRINRPAPSLDLKTILGGLFDCRRECAGEFWLEIMLVAGFNDTEEELTALREVVRRLEPDRVQLNTVVRPPASSRARRLSPEQLRRAAEVIGPRAEIIAPLPAGYRHDRRQQLREEEVARLLRRRPCTLTDIATGLAIHPNEATKFVQALLDRGQLSDVEKDHETYFFWRDKGSPPAAQPPGCNQRRRHEP